MAVVIPSLFGGGEPKPSDRIEFAIKVSQVQPKGWEKAGAPLAPDFNFTSEVYLGEKQIEYNDRERLRVIDFAEKRAFYQANKEAKNHVEQSLFAEVIYRKYELKNREHIKNVVEAAGLKEGEKKNFFNTTFSEHAFSMINTEAPGKLDIKMKDGQYIARSDGELLMEFSLKGKALNDIQTERFIRYLRYRYGIHPVVLDKLAALKIIPDSMVISTFNGVLNTYYIELNSVEGGVSHTFTKPQGERKLESKLLTELYQLALPLSKKGLEEKLETTLQTAIDLGRKGQSLDSMLTFLELTLMTGDGLPEEYNEFKERFLKEPQILKLFRNISPQSKDAAEEALINLAQLQGEAKAGSHIATIFRGNISSGLGKPEESINLLIEAIKINPYIVGLWKDIGDHLQKEFWIQDYWLCWQVALDLNLDHSMLKPLLEMKAELIKAHPEYFVGDE